MTSDEIFAKLCDVLRDVFDDSTLQPTLSTSAKDVEDWDSTNHVRVMVAIEAEFGVRFDSDEMSSPETVGDLVKLIAEKL